MIDIKYNWDETQGIMTASVEADGIVLTATAQCHPEDMDMCSQFTGKFIAAYRLLIKSIQYRKNHILRPQLTILYHIKSLYERNPNYDSNNYEVRTLRRQIKLIEEEISEAKKTIQENKEELRNYILSKDGFYKKVRAKRGQNKLNTKEEISE